MEWYKNEEDAFSHHPQYQIRKESQDFDIFHHNIHHGIDYEIKPDDYTIEKDQIQANTTLPKYSPSYNPEST